MPARAAARAATMLCTSRSAEAFWRASFGQAGYATGDDGKADRPGDGVRQPRDVGGSHLAAPPDRMPDVALFLTRQHRWAPSAENRSHRSMEKNPRSARLRMPSPNYPGGLICQGVLPVVIAADRCSDPTTGAGAHARHDQQLGGSSADGHPRTRPPARRH